MPRTRGDALAAGLVLAAAAILLLPRLGAPDLWAPDEPRYAQVAEELRAGAGRRLVLHLDGEPYAQKPPLYFWLAALAGAPEGRVGERAARLPSALAGVVTVALTLALGSTLLGRRSGILGAALLLTLPAFARLARRAQLDVVLALLELAALAAYARGAGLPRLRRRDLAWLHGALGLAVLAKGPVGLVVPLLALVSHRVWERRPLRDLAPPAFLLLSLGPGLVWLGAAAASAGRGFLADALGENLLGRFFLGTSHARPASYYLGQLPIDFLPWTLLWPALAVVGRRVFAEPASRRASTWRLLLCWVGAAVLFLSLSSGKRGLYLIPTFPALALLCGDALHELLPARGSSPRWERGLFALLLVAALGLAAALPFALAQHGLAAPAASPALAAAAGVALLLRAGLRGQPRGAFAAGLGLVFAVEIVAAFAVLPALDPQKSPRPVAEAAAAHAPTGSEIATARPSLVGALRYYGGHPVRRVGSVREVERFLAEGGRVLVLPADRLGLVARLIPVEVRARFREGSRALLVATPLEAGPGERAALGYAPAAGDGPPR